MKKNKMAPILFIAVFALIIPASTTFSTIIKANSRKEQNVQTLVVAGNLFSLKNNRFPADLEELMSAEGIQPVGDDRSNYQYELIDNGNDCRISVKLRFKETYSARCTQEDFD